MSQITLDPCLHPLHLACTLFALWMVEPRCLKTLTKSVPWSFTVKWFSIRVKVCCVVCYLDSGLKSNNDCFHLIVTSSRLRFLLPSVCPVFASLTCLYIHVSFFLFFFLVIVFPCVFSLLCFYFVSLNFSWLPHMNCFHPVHTCVNLCNLSPTLHTHLCFSLVLSLYFLFPTFLQLTNKSSFSYYIAWVLSTQYFW